MERCVCRHRGRNFNSRSHVGNDDSPLAVPYPVNEFQFTFPRGERPCIPSGTNQQRNISIHVPTWGTTENTSDQAVSVAFQFTFPRGERRAIVPANLRTARDFNSRSHVGNDGTLQSGLVGEGEISIHVPTWGTTLCGSAFLRSEYFNSRSHVGNDG